MARYSGEVARDCERCGEPVEFAIGLDAAREILHAQHFGPGGPQPVAISDWSAKLVTEAQVVLSVSFACPLCGAEQAAAATCRRVPAPGEDTLTG